MPQTNGHYTGPILYIVHAPVSHNVRMQYMSRELSDVKLVEANEKKIISALKQAVAKRIPVFYEDTAKKVRETTKSLSVLPRIIQFESESINTPSKLAALAKQECIVPTRVIGFGCMRDFCVIDSMQMVSLAFPKAETIMLEGASTIYRQKNLVERGLLRTRLKSLGIKRAKKLSFKHLI
ncbi:Uncharacterised protein [uncultured archaeon]|nr:Uncharacterised protein [uncultured archaeon]